MNTLAKTAAFGILASILPESTQAVNLNAMAKAKTEQPGPWAGDDIDTHFVFYDDAIDQISEWCKEQTPDHRICNRINNFAFIAAANHNDTGTQDMQTSATPMVEMP